ncbi:hypothetical protein [Patulibacter defluvii]|uniref:hypothetical protein n=1 Tax=Patulibacter defluvii TaxID=3095358 RepID=UPI002A748F79|nr:hypothetical protein [Patulibacter sp. DM4]
MGRRGKRIALAILGIALVAGIGTGAWWIATADERTKDDVAAAVRQARTAAGATGDWVDEAAVCRGLDGKTRTRLEALARAQYLDGADDCRTAVENGGWRLGPTAEAGEERRGLADAVRLDGDRARVAAVDGAPEIALRREDGTWRVDLTEDPSWTWKMDLATACGITARRLIGAGVPGATVASFRRMYRVEARALRRFAKVVRAGRPTERDSKAARRAIVRRAREAAARATRMAGVVRALASPSGPRRAVVDPPRGAANRIPVALNGVVFPEIGGCLQLRGEGYDSGAVENERYRAQLGRECRAWVRGLRRAYRTTVRSFEQARALQDRVVRQLDRLVRPLDRLPVPRELRPVRRRVRERVAGVRGVLRDLVVYSRRGDFGAVERVGGSFSRSEFGMRIGMLQLGVGCGGTV